MSKTTILDVARAAGVSPASVSNYLNGRYGEMREETRLRIAAAVKATGFVPNTAARQLKTGRAPLIALLVPNVANSHFGELALAVDIAAQRRGFHMILCNTHRNPGNEMSIIREVADGGVRGVISALALRGNIEKMREFIDEGVSFVFLENANLALTRNCADIVSIDQERATEIAVAHLAVLGHTSIAYLTLGKLTDNRMARLDGYKKMMGRLELNAQVITESGLPVPETPFDEASCADFGRSAAARLARESTRPGAIICMNDMTAIGLVAGLSAAGLKIPDDISVIGIDNIAFSQFTTPPLTTFSQPYDLLAEAALEKLVAALDDPGRKKSRSLFDPLLIRRDSTAACAKAPAAPSLKEKPP